MKDALNQSVESQGLFPATHWSAILGTGEANLGGVYQTYREPLIQFLLCLRYTPEDADDMVQGFFASLLKYGSLASVSPNKGRFRTFLITSLKHYLSDQLDRAQAAKRGGGQSLISVEELLAKNGNEPALIEKKGPDWHYDRAWANSILKSALQKLEEEAIRAGRGGLVKTLIPIMHQDANAISYKELASELGTTEGAVKTAAKRLRDRLNYLIRQTVLQTVSDRQEFLAELRYLIDLLGQP